MRLADPAQKFQDWFTQQWALFRGKKINPEDFSWLIGPFGNLNAIGEDFIDQLAKKEGLIIDRTEQSKGLISSIDSLQLTESEKVRLSEQIISFYENTTDFNFDFGIEWNASFKIIGTIINKLFSKRLKQLHFPVNKSENNQSIKSEIITLTDPETNEVKYTFWLKSFEPDKQIIYVGIYGICRLPSGKTCVKVVFPLPKGNATVIMSPSVDENGALTLDSSGKKFGDPGFYFLLNDVKGDYWTQYISSFHDRLNLQSTTDGILAEQILTFRKRKVLTFKYKITSCKK